MFLHSGASLHGHEYSARGPSPQPPPKHIPFLRSALRPRTDADLGSPAQSPPSETSSSGRVPSEEAAMASTPPPRRHTAPNAHLKRDLSVRFRDQLMDDHDQAPSTPASEDEESVAGSELSDATELSTRWRKHKRMPRQSTRFALAHPAPRLRTKQRRLVQIRPRLLLQLQQLGDTRATPAFDVIPSSLVAGSILIPRLAKRFPRVFRMKPELGQDDVLIVRSEDYGSPNAESTRKARGVDDSLDHRDVVGVISTAPHGSDGNVEIVVEDGSIWTASQMVTGSYEFTSIDDGGNTTTARWIKKSVAPSRRSSVSAGTMPLAPECKWTFSIIDPSTRRHPIMGVIRSNALEIFDTYNTMSTSSGRFPPTRAFSPEVAGAPVPRSPRTSIHEERAPMPVPDEHKRLMQATGIFVSLRQEGWPASSHPKQGRVTAHCRSVSTSSGTPERSRPIPTSNAASPASSRPSSPRAVNRASHDGPGTARHSLEAGVPAPMPANGTPQRAMSSGAAYMRRRRRTLGRAGDGPVEREARVRTHQDDDEKTHTCRFSVRHLTQKLFHRRSLHQRHRDEALRYKLEE